jgi:hypothetical protein
LASEEETNFHGLSDVQAALKPRLSLNLAVLSLPPPFHTEQLSLNWHPTVIATKSP